ncbi:putative multiple sugar transport system substrate-binding protein [Psychromicrobium silvestre]|uniref:Putative multiple sugar transport system substrate-binding protein n=1 Tax=Psychromicrobium silvestre TaxID=1645614 RepID=A0A7Y9LVM3_9MICC|nr:sugar-binding protein [Psychromicrobium silvestre]NYE96445.1 putative multiple sugar transport system substrate-binding protein [Psychromicrobium silvestre]
MVKFTKTLTSVAAIAAISALALTGCGRSDSGSGSSSSGAAGFDKSSLIGVALPQKTSENWVQAEGLFNDGLKNAGFKGEVQFANGGVTEQQNQISSMITNGAKVIIVGAVDGGQLGTQVKQAKDAGATIIAYDRDLTKTSDVDYYVAYNNFKVGELQGQALLAGMKAKKPNGPYNIEVFAGSNDDANSKPFFDGAMSVLKPKIDDGTVKIVSGQSTQNAAATAGWLAENARKRMDTLLAGSYSTATLDGVLSPNDTLARAIIGSVKAAGKPIPVITGQDSEVDSVKSIMAGEQYSTINKDTSNLVTAAIQMVKDLQEGKTPTTNEKDNNGSKEVPTQYLEPVIVTKANAAEAYKNNPTLEALTK